MLDDRCGDIKRFHAEATRTAPVLVPDPLYTPYPVRPPLSRSTSTARVNRAPRGPM